LKANANIYSKSIVSLLNHLLKAIKKIYTAAIKTTTLILYKYSNIVIFENNLIITIVKKNRKTEKYGFLSNVAVIVINITIIIFIIGFISYKISFIFLII